MSEIDRAAAVLAGRLGQDWATMPDEARLAVRGHVAAVIEAIREPSTAMQEAGGDLLLDGTIEIEQAEANARGVYHAMIDAMLRGGRVG